MGTCILILTPEEEEQVKQDTSRFSVKQLPLRKLPNSLNDICLGCDTEKYTHPRHKLSLKHQSWQVSIVSCLAALGEREQADHAHPEEEGVRPTEEMEVSGFAAKRAGKPL